MDSAAHTRHNTGPPLRMVLDSKRLVLRGLCFALGLLVLVTVFGGSVAFAVLLASTALAAMFFERFGLSREVSRRLEIVAAAAQAEGQRDAIAQVMSLELAYERSRSVLEALGEGVLVVDEGGEIVLANPKARSVMAAPMREPTGRILWEALAPELAERAREAFDALRSGTPRDQSGCDEASSDDELPIIRYSALPCGDRVFDMVVVQATSRRTGQDFGTVFLLVDITRTHDLQRIKDRFLSNVSHELRTPLTNICAYSEILCNMLPGESAEWPEFARIVNEEGVELSELVDGMFDFLQLESGEAVFHNEVLDGAAVVSQVVEKRRAKASARGITIALTVGEDAPQIAADGNRLGQVTRHLLDNAIKFAPDNGLITVAVQGRDEGWELRVEDTGPGVLAEDREAVFEKFNQLRNQMTEKPSGTGIGLATSRAIVSRLGGLIWCEDSSIGGASFVVLLPCAGQPNIPGVDVVSGSSIA